MVVTLHFRQRFALELGEAVAHDMRLELFRKLTDAADVVLQQDQVRPHHQPDDLRHRQRARGGAGRGVRGDDPGGADDGRGAADGLVQLEALLADAAAGAGDLGGEPELPARGEPPTAQAAGNLEPADLHAGRIGERHPGHPGLCAAGDQRRLLPQAGEPARRKQRGRGAGLGGVHSPAADEEPAFPGRRWRCSAATARCAGKAGCTWKWATW